MRKLVTIFVALTLLVTGSVVALGQEKVPCTNEPAYPQLKVAQVPIPWQFWALEVDPDTGETTVIDRIRISPTWLNPPPSQPAGVGPVFIRRMVARAALAEGRIPLEELVWSPEGGPVPTRDLKWVPEDREPIEVVAGQDVELRIPMDDTVNVVLVAYEVSTGAGIVGHFINEAILESQSPQTIVEILVNFDIHNGTGRNDITNFELDFEGLDFGCADVLWAVGFVRDTKERWGANADNPLVVRPILGGTEVKWVQPDRPLQTCEWLHVGLSFKYTGGFVDNVDATVQGYWTVLRGTPGYWKNHPELWPVDEITIGGQTYTKDEAIDIMKYARHMKRRDKTYSFFSALVAAKLNVLTVKDNCSIMDTIKAADAWMSENPVGSGVRGSDDAWQVGEPLYDKLDAYNNGEPCAANG